jgi:hypothetical protein
VGRRIGVGCLQCFVCLQQGKSRGAPSPVDGRCRALARGSGNVFRDLGRENADVKQLKALLAAEIIKALDRDELSVVPPMPEPVSPRPTSRASGTPTSRGSLLTD